MSDPSLLLTRPALTDPHPIRRACHRYPRAAVAAGAVPESACAPRWIGIASGPAYLSELLKVLEARGYRGIVDHFTVDHLDTPQTWHDRGMIAGTPFSAAHLFRQTGPFRTRNLARTPANVVLAGCGTTPGVGVPTALLSGKLAAERVAGSFRHVVGATAPTGALGLPANH